MRDAPPSVTVSRLFFSSEDQQMAETTAAEHAGRFEASPNVGNHFAFIRTRLALERTMMAWVRTAVALIGFGFTIVQFFERLGGMEGVSAAMRPFAARYVGLSLIGAGILVLAISALQYRRMVGYLFTEFHAIAAAGPRPVQTPTYAVMIFIALIGVFAFLAVLTRAV
jgi:putative membrane protein